MSSNLCLPDTGKGEEKMTANNDVEKESHILIPQAEHNFDEQFLMVKILQSENTGSKYRILIMNNCPAILQSVDIHHAAEMVLIDISKVQDDEECNSLRSVVVACDELLQDGESLICFQIVAAGWQLAHAQTNVLDQSAISIDDDEFSQRKMMQTLRTSLSSNLLAHKRVHLAIFSVDAVIRLNGSGNKRKILVFKGTGRSIKDFYPEPVGVGQTRRLQQCAILLANKSDLWSTSERNKVAKKGLAVKGKMRRNCKRIFAYVCNDLINHQLIHSLPETIFAKHGVMAGEHAYSDGIEQLDALNGGIGMVNDRGYHE
jgi:TCP-1/cpn60 chaperonin family